MRIRPESGATAPVRILTRLLLPAPFAPMRAWTSPGPTTSEAFRSAATAPYRFATSLASSSSSVIRLADQWRGDADTRPASPLLVLPPIRRVPVSALGLDAGRSVQDSPGPLQASSWSFE